MAREAEGRKKTTSKRRGRVKASKPTPAAKQPAASPNSVARKNPDVKSTLATKAKPAIKSRPRAKRPSGILAWVPFIGKPRKRRTKARQPAARPMPPIELLAYASVAAPLALPELLLLVLLPAFFAERLGIGLAAIGFALTAARMVDLISDPVVGVLSDRMHTRLGLRRPWMVGGIVPVVVAAFFLIFPTRDAGPVYLFVWASVMYLGWNAIRTPYRAWGAELVPRYDFRTDIAGMREMMGLLGIIATMALPVAFSNGPLAPFWAAGAPPELATIFWALLILLPLATAMCMARVEGRDPEPVRPRYPLKTAWLEIMGNRPFHRFLLVAGLAGLGHGLFASMFLLMVRHVLSRPEQGLRFLAFYFAVAALTVPVAAWLSRKKTKHRVWAWLMCVSAAGMMVTPAMSAGNVPMMAVICAAAGIGLGADLCLGYAVLADVVDFDRLRSGERRAGTYFGLTGLAVKAAAAISVTLGFGWLAVIGFETGAVKPDSVQVFLFAAFIGGAPALARFLAAIVIWDFRPGRYKQEDIRKALGKRDRRRPKRRKPERPKPPRKRRTRKRAANPAKLTTPGATAPEPPDNATARAAKPVETGIDGKSGTAAKPKKK